MADPAGLIYRLGRSTGQGRATPGLALGKSLIDGREGLIGPSAKRSRVSSRKVRKGFYLERSVYSGSEVFFRFRT
jgi:hypothetical protein